MNSRQRVSTALDHGEPDRVPLDLGGSAVTGMQVSRSTGCARRCAWTRRARPSRSSSPTRCWARSSPTWWRPWASTSSASAGHATLFGFPTRAGSRGRFDGTPVLVPGAFNTDPEPNGDILMYPEGDKSAPPSGRMPKRRLLLRHHHPPAADRDEDKLNVEDNLEEFGPISDADLEYFRVEAERLHRADATRRSSPTSAARPSATSPWCPPRGSKHPKGIRDIEEWYVSTVARRDYVYAVFERQCEIALANLEKISRRRGGPRVGGLRQRHGLRHAERAVHLARRPTASCTALPQAGERLGPRPHGLEDLHPLLRLGHAPD